MMRKLARAYQITGWCMAAALLPFAGALIGRGALWLIAPFAGCCVMVWIGQRLEHDARREARRRGK